MKIGMFAEPRLAGLGQVLADDAVTPLCTALNDNDWFVRWNAALALGLIGDPRAVDPLIGALHDVNRYVRRKRRRGSLGNIRNTRATGWLIESLQDPDVDVRLGTPLTRSENSETSTQLIPLIHALSDPDEFVRERAADAARRIRDVRAGGCFASRAQG